MLAKLKTNIRNSPPVVGLEKAAQRIILPGFEGLSLYEVSIFLWEGFQKGAINTRSASMSFKFFLALFPGIIFLFTLIPYVPVENFREQLLMQLETFLPNEAYMLTKTTIEDLITNQRGGLLSFGFLLTMYFATNGINAMIGAFNQSHHITEKRNLLSQRLISIALIFILAGLVMAAVSLIIFGKMTLSLLLEKGILESKVSYYLLNGSNWLVILALFYFSISFIYYLGAIKRKQWRFLSAGSTLAAVLTIITSLGFAWYVNNFGQFNKLYGSIGTLIVIMLWINLNSTILLIGFELNASIKRAKGEKMNSIN